MNTKDYIKSLFKNYEETGALRDFMEELQSNLDARIASLVRKGLPEQEAFDKAQAELGDIGALADELSLQKKQEVYMDAYLAVHKYMRPRRAAAYVLFGLTALFGVIIAFLAYYSTVEIINGDIGRVSAVGAVMPFLVTAAAGFTYLGLTQETKSRFPMNKGRAALYTLAAALLSFGLIMPFVTYFSVNEFVSPALGVVSALGVLIPFVLPGAGILVFLCLTEKNRQKPWAVK